ncbi:hypothetical protein PC128_g21898 [Phytophthora cactorum]|nr:hypothetical protein PC120_g25596 [Phytophthora cactorum]KAG3050401.1 hypothetical protein PC121_g18414 [Phytophthora cactorum]KAG3156319.1 hypothetical protein PC128_g21898 [Phytophthora cactorum]
MDLEKIEEAKGAIPYEFEDSKTYIVPWKEFASMTQDQLTVMERIVGVKKTLREIGFTLDWKVRGWRGNIRCKFASVLGGHVA